MRKSYASYASSASDSSTLARNSCIYPRKSSPYPATMDTIHTRIKAARDRLGLSMEQVADQLGLSAWQTVQQWENGSTAPSRRRLPKVAELLGVTQEYLLSGARDGAPTAGTRGSGSIASLWPFRRISPDDYFALSESDRSFLEGILAAKIEDLNKAKSEKSDSIPPGNVASQ